MLGACLLSVFILEGSRTFLRPAYGIGTGFIPDLLGSLPNFMAGFGMPLLPFCVYYAIIKEASQVDPSSILGQGLNKQQLCWIYICISILTSAGLIMWEYHQLDSRLIFDYKDIGATIIGGILSILYFVTVLKRKNPKVAKANS
jgi:hypothetical protein